MFDGQLPVFQDSVVEFFQGFLETFHDDENVGPGLLDRVHDDGRHADMPHHQIDVLVSEFHAGDVSDCDRSVVFPLYDDLFDIGFVSIFSDGSRDIAAFSFVEISRADVLVFHVQGLHQFRNADVSGGQGVGVHDDLHFPLLPAVDVGGRDPRDPFQAGLDVLIQKVVLVLEISGVSLDPLQDHPGDRLLSSASGLDHGLFGVQRVALDLVELVGNAQQGFVGARADFEHQVDVRSAVAAFALHFVETLQVFQLVFLHVGDLPFHLHGACASPYGFDGNFGQVHVGGQLDGNSEEGEDAEKYQENHAHRHGDGLFYGGIDDFHGATTFTGCPGLSRSFPRMTTRSPGCKAPSKDTKFSKYVRITTGSGVAMSFSTL